MTLFLVPNCDCIQLEQADPVGWMGQGAQHTGRTEHFTSGVQADVEVPYPRQDL